MQYDYFCKAVDTLVDHPGLIGIIGGEPTLHPKFKEMCEYLQNKVSNEKGVKFDAFKYPTDSFIEVRRRFELDEYEIHEYDDGPRPIIRGAGLWTSMTNLYKKYFEIIQDTFSFQNLNDHTNVSFHQPVLISRKDMGIDDETWEKLKNQCWINQEWSGSITPKGCFFCEVAGALDILYDGPGGLPLEDGWWRKDINAFKDQFHWCELCGVPLRTFARDAREEVNDISKTNYELLKKKNTVKFDEGKFNVVRIKNGVIDPESIEKTSRYHGVSYMEDAQDRLSGNSPIYPGSFIGVIVADDECELDFSIINHNLMHLERIYIVISGILKKIIYRDYLEECHIKIKIEDLRHRFGQNIFMFIMSPEIKVGVGVEKLKNCVINPGTLHYTDVEEDGSNSNSYIDSDVKSGKCILISSFSISLDEIDGEGELDKGVFMLLYKYWNPNKRLRLTSEMDIYMYGVADSSNDGKTFRRRMADAKKLMLRWNREYGTPKTLSYVLRMIKRYGVKLMKQKLRNRLF